MAERLQFDAPSIFTERVSEVNYDDGTVDLLNQLSGTFLGVAQKAHKSQLRSLVTQAKKDGALEGGRTGATFKPIKGKGIVHQTFNDSGIVAATTKMSNSTQRAIQRAALDNPSNPFAQQASMDKWAEGFTKDLDDALIAPFRENFEILQTAQITKANNDLQKVRQDEAAAQFNDYETTVKNSVESFAPNMFEPGDVGVDAAKAMETVRKNYIELLSRNGPGAAYSIGGYDVPAASGRTNAFTVEQIGKKIAAFDQEALGSAVKGDFLRDLEAGRGVSAYFNFVKGTTALTRVNKNGDIEQVPVDSILNIDDKEKISNFMRTHIKTINSFEASADKKADRAKDQYNDFILDSALQSAFTVQEQPDGVDIVQGNPDVLRLHYLSAVNDTTGLVTKDTIDELQDLMETVGTGDIPDPTIISKTNLAIIQREIRSATELPASGLGDKARGEMVTLTRQINAGAHWSNSRRYQSMITLGQAALAPEASAGFALFSDPSKTSAANFAEFKETLMNEMIEAENAGLLPTDINAQPSGEEFDVQKRAKEIIDDIKAREAAGEADPEIDALNVQIKDLNATLNNPDTTETAAKNARDELKRVMSEKTRLKSARIGIK